MRKHVVIVSPEMTSFIGTGTCDKAAMPPDPLLLGFSGLDGSDPAISILSDCNEADGVAREAPLLVFAVSRSACVRLFGFLPPADGRWCLPADQRALILSIMTPDTLPEANDTLRLARSIELLCQIFTLLGAGQLIGIERSTNLTEGDIRRIAAARRLVDERWQEKLTIDDIARTCGLNRDKLTRGFRTLYNCTISEALIERRLSQARTLLSASDLPVASIGYRCGYLNNASFARAFARRYGMAPTEMRRIGIAA